MSDAFATDLSAKIQTVTVLTNHAGFAVGGRSSDPALTKIPLPAAWILLSGDSPTEGDNEGMVPTAQVLLVEYAVMVYVPYASQDDLISTQFPLLRAVRTAIHATNAPNGNRWKYRGQKLVLVNTDRLLYRQTYSVRVST